MDYSLRRGRLLAVLWRERNGAVADAMRFCGEKYARNYGVSLSTLRSIARREGCDHAFARDLYVQPVRELRLAALHVADPMQVGPEEFSFWAVGILNSEVAEEAAFALLGRIDSVAELFGAWIMQPNLLLQYTALLAAARSPRLDVSFLAPALDACVQAAGQRPVETGHAGRLVAQGAAILAVAIGRQSDENRRKVLAALAAMEKSPAAEYLRDEVPWQLEGYPLYGCGSDFYNRGLPAAKFFPLLM